MTEKRFTLIDGFKKGTHTGIWDNQKQNNQRIGDELWLGEVVGMLNEGVMIAEENELLKNKLDRIEDILPHYLSCAEISEFHSKIFKEDIALMKCWNKRYQK